MYKTLIFREIIRCVLLDLQSSECSVQCISGHSQCLLPLCIRCSLFVEKNIVSYFCASCKLVADHFVKIVGWTYLLYLVTPFLLHLKFMEIFLSQKGNKDTYFSKVKILVKKTHKHVSTYCICFVHMAEN